MSRSVRLWLFAPALVVLAGFLVWSFALLPAFGNYRGPYGDVLNSVAPPERHVTDVVSAVNFDYRAIDTLGEEFILFASVIGVMLLLREHPDEVKEEIEDEQAERKVPFPSDAVRVMSLLLIPPTVLFGVYIVTHGHLTPGGGFQGGAIIVSALALVYLAAGFKMFKRLIPHQLVDLGEGLGAGGFVIIGLAGIAAGATFLENVLPTGETGDVLSGGTIWLISVTTGLEVAAGLYLVIHTFLEKLLEHVKEGDGRGLRKTMDDRRWTMRDGDAGKTMGDGRWRMDPEPAKDGRPVSQGPRYEIEDRGLR
ncbi:MAG: MnhB domain-containing protein [Chloroflexia bacterium]